MAARSTGAITGDRVPKRRVGPGIRWQCLGLPTRPERDRLRGRANVTIEYRWAERHYDRLKSLADDLVHRQVAVIVAARTMQAVVAAKAATAIIPIVFNVGRNPVELGLVSSFNRPGGNATGTSMLTVELVPKRLELLHELVPQAMTVAYLRNPDDIRWDQQTTNDVKDAARSFGLQMHIIDARSERDFEQAFAALMERKVGGLVVGADPIYLDQHKQLVALAERYRVPACYAYREFPAAGGLLGYGASAADTYRQLGIYAGRIIKGERPADLPVMQPSKFDLVINLKTAQALGLTVPPTLFALANEVIE